MSSSTRQAVIILGMHRSGTSALTGTLARLGLALPKTPLDHAADNPEGFYESERIEYRNFEILREEGCAWNICVSLDPAALQAKTTPQRFEELYKILRDEFGDTGSFVLKEPRLCLLLPLWFPGIKRLSTSQHVLLIARHPTEVAHSLSVRNNLPQDEVLTNWLHHTLEAEHMTRALPRAALLFEDLLCDWRTVLSRALRTAGISTPKTIEDAGDDIERFLNPTLRHHEIAAANARIGSPALAPMVDTCWRAFTALARNPHDDYARAALDDTRANFFLFRQNLIRAGYRAVLR
jgi:hypothetical protein